MITGRQIKEALFRAAVISCDYGVIHYDKVAEILNKWIEDEPKEIHITLTVPKELTDKLDKILEQFLKQSPQKEIQERNCENCDKRFNDNGEANEDCVGCVKQDKFDKVFYTHWESEETPQEKSCATCGHFDIICKKDWCGDSYKGWQPKDNQESR